LDDLVTEQQPQPAVHDTLALAGINEPEAKILFRRRIRTSFLEWCRFVEATKGQSPAAHHKLIINVLQRVTDGDLRNVILLMPPGAAKSTYTSVDFPPYYMARHPQHLILACSYSYSLVEGFGRQCRDLIEKYQNELGYELSKSAAASGDWRIDKGGGYFCAGVGAGIAGHRADLGFIDDYLGSQEDADSDRIRQKQWEWYWNDFWPRLKPKAAQVIIANRRHEDDLVGRLLKKDPSAWTVIRLPYFAEQNDPLGRQPGVTFDEKTEKMSYNLNSRLWPEWFDEDHANAVIKLESRVLAGLYQQRPAPEEGSYFKRHMLVGYTLDDLASAERNGLRIYVGSDYAVKTGEDNDNFCFIAAGLDQNNRLWILPDWWWEQSDTATAVANMFRMAKKHKPIVWWAGKENITGSIAPFLFQQMRVENCYIAIEELSEAKDKQQKAQAIKAYMTNKMVLFPKFAPTWNEIETQLLSFPGGEHDDFVDALAKLGQGLAKMVPVSKPPEVWDGVIPEQRITCRWVERSHQRRERVASLINQDN
jgi:predicted phage terminase large subunit-like protein